MSLFSTQTVLRVFWFVVLGALLPDIGLTDEAAPSDSGFAFHRPDSYLARVESLALLESFNAALLSQDSATATLEEWCAEHHLAATPSIVAERETAPDRPLDDEQRQQLQIGPGEAVRYRKVRLRCGDVVMSEAENWYVPSRLSAAMNLELDDTDTPFGKVVQALKFQRHTLSSTLLWHPLPAGWEQAGSSHYRSRAALLIPARILQHRAVLSLPDGTPFSEVIETYSGRVLAFGSAAH